MADKPNLQLAGSYFVWRSPDRKTWGVVIDWGPTRDMQTMTEAPLRATVAKIDETTPLEIAEVYRQALAALDNEKGRVS